MNAQLLKDGVLLIDVEALDCSELESRLAPAWPLVAEAVKQRVQTKQPHEFVHLRLYVRYESGLIWFSLEGQKPTRHVTVAGVKLACLEALYYRLPDGAEDMDGFEQAHAILVDLIQNALRHSTVMPEAKEALKQLQAWLPMPITLVDYDDLETERPLQLDR
jgi:hypothetical protein